MNKYQFQKLLPIAERTADIKWDVVGECKVPSRRQAVQYFNQGKQIPGNMRVVKVN